MPELHLNEPPLKPCHTLGASPTGGLVTGLENTACKRQGVESEDSLGGLVGSVHICKTFSQVWTHRASGTFFFKAIH